MSQNDFAARLARLQPETQSAEPDAHVDRRELPTAKGEPASQLRIFGLFLVVWGALFLIFGFIYFLGSIGVPSRPTRWMLETGLDGIAVITFVFAALPAIFSYFDTRGYIDHGDN